MGEASIEPMYVTCAASSLHPGASTPTHSMPSKSATKHNEIRMGLVI
jgi:hypothetical protein